MVILFIFTIDLYIFNICIFFNFSSKANIENRNYKILSINQYSLYSLHRNFFPNFLKFRSLKSLRCFLPYVNYTYFNNMYFSYAFFNNINIYTFQFYMVRGHMVFFKIWSRNKFLKLNLKKIYISLVW